MTWVRVLCACAVLSLSWACGTDAGAARRPSPVVAQVVDESQAMALWKSTEGTTAPVVAWLRSVKDKDARLLERALSVSVKAKLGDVDWADLLAYYERWLEKALGPWALEEFVFTGIVQSEGLPKAAEVQCKFAPKGRAAKDLRIDVAREGAEWRIDVFPAGYKKPPVR